MLDLSIGGMMAYLAIYSAPFIKKLKNIPSYILSIGYCVGLLSLFLFHMPSVVQAIGTYGAALSKISITLFFAFVILEQNFCDNSLFKLGKFKNLSKLGKYTYGMYLLHPIVITALFVGIEKLSFPQNGYGFSGLVFTAMAVLLTTFMAILSYKFIESPFLQIKKRFQY